MERAHELGAVVLLDLAHPHVSASQTIGLNHLDFGHADGRRRTLNPNLLTLYWEASVNGIVDVCYRYQTRNRSET